MHKPGATPFLVHQPNASFTAWPVPCVAWNYRIHRQKYVADRHSWACNLSSYIKTLAPPLIIPSFHHSKTLHKQYTPQPHTTIHHHYHSSILDATLSAIIPATQSTQWPLLPTTSPQWHQTTFLHAQDHHQHALCLLCHRNRLERLADLSNVPPSTGLWRASTFNLPTIIIRHYILQLFNTDPDRPRNAHFSGPPPVMQSILQQPARYDFRYDTN
jgi:hypothetical protein